MSTTSFWGLRLIPGESYTIKNKGILHLKQVSLEDEPKAGTSLLKVEARGHTFVLCRLAKDKVERQKLTHFFIAEDKASLMLKGDNPVNLIGFLEQDSEMSSDEDEDMDDEEEDDDERETISGQPMYSGYLSDLLGPDLPDEDDEDYEDMEAENQDEFGTLAFRDPTDNDFIGGFELRHFNLAPNVAGFQKVDLRAQEETIEDTLLNDNIATGLVNALINSGDDFQMKKGKEFLQKLKKQCKKRK